MIAAGQGWACAGEPSRYAQRTWNPASTPFASSPFVYVRMPDRACSREEASPAQVDKLMTTLMLHQQSCWGSRPILHAVSCCFPLCVPTRQLCFLFLHSSPRGASGVSGQIFKKRLKTYGVLDSRTQSLQHGAKCRTLYICSGNAHPEARAPSSSRR